MYLLGIFVLKLPEHFIDVKVLLRKDCAHVLPNVGALCVLDVLSILGHRPMMVDCLILEFEFAPGVQGRFGRRLRSPLEDIGLVGVGLRGEQGALRLNEHVLLYVGKAQVDVARGLEVRALVLVAGRR